MFVHHLKSGILYITFFSSEIFNYGTGHFSAVTAMKHNSEEDIACVAMIRAVLTGSDTCAALGLTAKSGAPVLALCRKLIEAGHDPSMPFEAYRSGKLCLRVRSIGEAARLRMDTHKTGRPVFKREKTTARASLVEFRREAAE